jgi:two-component system, LytTR family, sensor histidine kinase AlgZ
MRIHGSLATPASTRVNTESTAMRPWQDTGHAAAKLAAHVLADCLAVSLIVGFWLYLMAGLILPEQLWMILVQVWLYTIPIATAAHVIIPSMHPLVAERQPVVQWTVLVGMLITISVAGSVIGSVLVHVLNLEPEMPFRVILSRSVQVAVFLVLLVGIVHALVILLQDRLHATAMELRTQEVEYERALKLASEARLAALESRIHPHFLFNTLNTVSSLIPTAPARAERLLEQVSALLRFSLEAPQKGLVPLQQEMKIVTDYLGIEQARFGQRLRFTLDIDDHVRETQVPPFAVQTLVENCVKHAVDTSRKGAEIKIRAVLEGGSASIEVADNGPGFSSTDLPAGHGLDNLRSRLTVLFGDPEPLRMTCRDGWTAVGFRVPA